MKKNILKSTDTIKCFEINPNKLEDKVHPYESFSWLFIGMFSKKIQYDFLTDLASRAIYRLYLNIYQLSKVKVIPKCRFYWYANDVTFVFWGAFNNYVDRISSFFDPFPLRGQFLYPERGQKQTFLTPSPFILST